MEEYCPWSSTIAHCVRPKFCRLGATCNVFKIDTCSRWSLEAAIHHINNLELLAIFHAWMAVYKYRCDIHIQIKSDNVCAVTCI